MKKSSKLSSTKKRSAGSKLSLTKKRSAGSTRRVTRSSVVDKQVSKLLMEKEILEFCLDEVIKIEYNFYTLEKHVLLSAKRRIFSCFEHLIDTDVIDFITLFFENNDFLNEIQIKMMCAFPLLTQDVTLPTEGNNKKARKLTKAQNW